MVEAVGLQSRPSGTCWGGTWDGVEEKRTPTSTSAMNSFRKIRVSWMGKHTTSG
jgi:hypothetical protein